MRPVDDRGPVRQEPESLAALLQEVLRKLAPTAKGADHLEGINRAWSNVVGHEVARWTEVASYRGGTLVVRVASAPLLAELRSFGISSLLDGLAAEGLVGVHKLSFVSR
ncbi:MAG: DUF721 domain-containing protein [Planctomycetota bacterium]